MKRYTAGGYLPASFLDWDGHVSAVVFTSGCNFRCPWCHNSELVLRNTDVIEVSIIIDDICKRKNFLDGVVITGGEPCLWDGLFDFLRMMKDLNISVKLDTNGSIPDILAKVLENELADHVAMDVKAPLNKVSLKRVTGVDVDPEKIKRSIDIIKRSVPSYEFRTTFIDGLLSIEDMNEIRKELGDDDHWIIQAFRPVNCLDPAYCAFPAADAEKLREKFPGIKVRG
ncbi:MAG: anaerobic ribonucleoside-triphosphate reductase activating protein [Synergistaceae bacterium]|jgi:pyruvate formate lyase activating enzyme|nr:anaerobic ribonucleoside-triphosphate reductase activating protein [Synergistaceae bacterium]MDD2351367.1 anaerobic ribonucleoside-triphosphate reductase activating protein [Synergistaceae bacterium]MDD3318581.1 anaerobic ribonucleoside-triphosphate reductase activating protein [Synergistaceae bacterium]MDD3673109.1 anaerobic ribonucleoside-triphosphate reductase activating protein [Synergistaceae bacterium]MDD3962954.1 anaerobic ribonucleoside-triphosphate reductase activating protein [Syne